MILHPTYRAVFRHPIAPINPMNLPCPVAMTVEVYQASKSPTRWEARTVDFSPARPLPRLTASGSSQQARNAIAGYFKEQCQPWQMWARDDKGILRQIHPEEVDIKPDGKVWLKEPAKEAKRA